MEYYAAMKKYKFEAFVGDWMQLDIIILSTIGQIWKLKYFMVTILCKK